MEFDIKKVMKNLAKEKRAYSSESDFQLAMAMTIKNIYGDEVEVMCEVPPVYKSHVEDFNSCTEFCGESPENRNCALKSKIGSRVHIDIVVKYNNKLIPIELKYRTVRCILSSRLGENMELRDQVAHDEGCYGFARDICRIEEFKNNYEKCDSGFAVFLTNDEKYKDNIPSSQKLYSEYWINDLSAGKKCGRVGGKYKSLEIPDFTFSGWENFSQIDTQQFFYKIATI